MKIKELCFICSKEKKINKWRYFDCFWYKI